MKGGPDRKPSSFSKFSGAITPKVKQLGKERIFFGQSIHTYLRISWNLGDEIFPKGVGVVTLQKFYLVFQQKLCWFLKRGHLNFFQKTFLLKTSLARIFIFVSSSNYGVWSFKTLSLMVPFSKYIFRNYSFSYKKNSVNFEVFLILKTTHGFTMSPIVNLLKIPSSTFEQSKFSVSTSPNKF